MAALTIRNLNDSTKQGLRLRAARRGTSMEDEARSILRAVVEADLSLEEIAKKPTGSGNAWEGIVELRTKYGALDLEIPERTDHAGSRNVFGAE